MLPMLNSSGGPDEKKLRALFGKLNDRDKETLLRFAEFLAISSEPEFPEGEFPDPEAIQRPEKESVVKAIKRLTATYPIINTDKILHQTSDLMTAHLVNGRTAVEVINDLEQLFADHYAQLKKEFEQNC
uniref:Crp/Fnr family transcriptional regulator n=1 Tax=uncultured Thiotrichaceae bacterium TaxID=298394 RepID=A0A6S6UL45_9GAMM|nr:MAG: Unknown protein [uncultured Thiotrichaceae bacterium]